MAHVVVVGQNYSSTLGVVRSLGKEGHTVDVIYNAINRDGAVVSSCKYINNYSEIKGRSDSLLISKIRNFAGTKEKKVLLVTDDHSLEIVDRYRTELEDGYYMMGMRNGDAKRQIAYYMSKDVQMLLAKECGLPVAQSWIVDLDSNLNASIAGITYPCFVKPLVSADGVKGDIGKCDCFVELLEKLAILRKRGRKCVLVQEFLNIEREIVIDGVCNDQEIVLPGVIQKTRVAMHNKGVTTSGILVETDVLPENVLTAINRMLKQMHYVGMLDLELIIADGKYYFGEINLRSGGPCYIYTLCGVNLPNMAVSAMIGEEPYSVGDVTYHKTFVSDKVLWEDYLFDHISYKEFLECYRSADYSLTHDKTDPKPGRRFNYRMKKTKCKHVLKKAIMQIHKR